MSALACRCHIDFGPEDPDARQVHGRLKEWIAGVDVRDEMEDDEGAVIFAPLGKIRKRDRTRFSWYAEDLSILAWAMNRFSFPPFDRKVDPFELTDALAFLSPDAAGLITEANLRTATELQACREFYYAIHCRVLQFRRNRQGRDIAHWFEASCLKTLGVDGLLSAGNDLLVEGRPLEEVGERELEDLSAIACGRHRAIIWLTEEPGVYSSTPVDT